MHAQLHVIGSEFFVRKNLIVYGFFLCMEDIFNFSDIEPNVH